MPTTAGHPYRYTLDLFRWALDRLPPGFPGRRHDEYDRQWRNFAVQPEIDYEDIQQSISTLGKESWPFRMAYEEMYRVYGRSSEEAHLLERLDMVLRAKFEQFLHEGGKLNHIASAKSGEELWKAAPFEHFFTPEEKYSLSEALVLAREAARREIVELCVGAKKEEYERLIGKYRRRQGLISDKIEELRSLAGVSGKWQSEIDDQVRHIEEGWSIVERQPDVAELDKLLEYWKGTLEAFLAA